MTAARKKRQQDKPRNKKKKFVQPVKSTELVDICCGREDFTSYCVQWMSKWLVLKCNLCTRKIWKEI